MKRKQVVQDVHKSISKRLKARLLGVNLSSCYGVKKGLSENSVTLMNEIQDIYASRPFQGYRRITLDLKDKGYSETPIIWAFRALSRIDFFRLF